MSHGMFRWVVGYIGALLLLGISAWVLGEGHERIRAALGNVVVAVHAAAIWRLSWRFRRIAAGMWLVTVVLLCWNWVRWVVELQAADSPVALPVGASIVATVGVTIVAAREWGRLAAMSGADRDRQGVRSSSVLQQ
ncbi:MAG: hypothetical protein NZ960_08220 [Candidatus Kapabacteria bacterium]|nr:hypothetical protein [Candidatus Kapabacteria bacterium]MDW8012439.1 hypothetical protein [Bacteroidota bacterium]